MREHLGGFLIMAYSNFTLDTVEDAFQLEMHRFIGLFSEAVPVAPSDYLTAGLAKKAPLALAIDTEKAKSELIVADILVELCEHFDGRISLFSGVDFNVDAKSELTGVCDFLVSLSPNQFSVKAPIIILVAGKKDSLKDGLGQCVAEMVAAQRFNTEAGNDIPCVYGATTSGMNWLFLKLEGQQLSIDMTAYSIDRCDRLLGILASMVKQEA